MDLVFWSAITIFSIAYLFIISEKLHRTVAALTGAVLMILLGILNQEHAIEGVDFNTLGLLIGMMIIVCTRCCWPPRLCSAGSGSKKAAARAAFWQSRSPSCR